MPIIIVETDRIDKDCRPRTVGRPSTWSRDEDDRRRERLSFGYKRADDVSPLAGMNERAHSLHARSPLLQHYSTTAFVRRTIYSRWIKNVCGTKLAQTASSPKNSRMRPSRSLLLRADPLFTVVPTSTSTTTDPQFVVRTWSRAVFGEDENGNLFRNVSRS